MDRGEIQKLFKRVREINPLIHHITNPVTINDCANVTLAIGASPVMADYMEEVEDIVSKANALLLNFGTLNEDRFRSMLIAGKRANSLGVPIIFDPVGVRASSYRYDKAMSLLKSINIDIIKGNFSEIASLVGRYEHARGVDSISESSDIETIAKRVARTFNCVVVISGKRDIISDGYRVFVVENGDEWLAKVTGTGCTSGSLISTFAAVTEDYFLAAIVGISTMGICGERAIKALAPHEGLGTFKVKLMDEISLVNSDIWEKEVNIFEVENE